MREIKFRAWDEKKFHYTPDFNMHFSNSGIIAGLGHGGMVFNTNEAIQQYTGLKDKNGKEIYEGDVIEFWICYETTQTHTGDNIPTGSYTEPDEPQLVKIRGVVSWDEDRLCWSFSIVGPSPYQMDNAFILQHPDNVMPIIGRSQYHQEEVEYILGKDDMDDEDWNDLLLDCGFDSIENLMSEINEIKVIGSIHKNPELLKQ